MNIEIVKRLIAGVENVRTMIDCWEDRKTVSWIFLHEEIDIVKVIPFDGGTMYHYRNIREKDLILCIIIYDDGSAFTLYEPFTGFIPETIEEIKDYDWRAERQIYGNYVEIVDGFPREMCLGKVVR